MENQEMLVSEGNNGLWGKLNSLKPNTKKKRLVAAVIIAVIIFLSWYFISKTSGEIAELSLTPVASGTTVTAGQNFDIDVNLDTKNNNVVEVKAVVTYNPDEFFLVSAATHESIFATNNSCVYNGHFCEIINNEPGSGKITITAAKPTPGVNDTNGLIARLTFQPLRAFTASTANIRIDYSGFGNYDDSDVILDDQFGTDILSKQPANDLTLSSVLPVPAGFVATAASATSINLTWRNYIGAFDISGYKIYQDSTLLETVGTNSYQITGLAPSTLYGSYRVAAIDANGNESAKTSGQSATTLADTTAPSAPGNIAGSASMSSEINLSWTAATDDVAVTGYNIYRDGSLIGTSTIASFTDTGLAPETDYDYQIEAYDAAGNKSAKSAAASFTTNPDTAKPTVPANVSAAAISISQINLSWNAASDNVGVAGYKIFRNGIEINTAASTNYQDTGLALNTTYIYTVSAYDAKNNESEKSSPVSATTNSDTEAPSMPGGNLSAIPASMTQMNLSWGGSADNVAVTGYKIFRNTIQIGTSATTNYQDTGLTKNTAYTYTVSAYDAAGNQSAPMSPVSATTLNDSEPPTVPANLNATPISISQIDLSWSASTDNIGVAGYKIFRNGQLIGTKSPEVTTYNDTNLAAGTAYSYAVLAYDADGNQSAQTAPVSATTLSKKYGSLNFSALVDKWLQPDTETDSLADAFEDDFINTRDLGVMMSNWE